MNTSEDMWARIDGARMKVQRMQTKLHRWARGDSGLRFDDLFNLVHDPDFLRVAWQRGAGNTGAHTPGIDEVTEATIQFWVGMDEFLGGIRLLVKSGEFRPGRISLGSLVLFRSGLRVF